MKNIALAILSIGLCFHLTYFYEKTGERDSIAAFIALIAAIGVFIV